MKKIEFSKHALLRMEVRGATKEKCPDNILKQSNNQGGLIMKA